MDPKWFAGHVAYTMSKYGMSMCTLGMSEELRAEGIAVNSLWPRTTIATAAVEVHFPAAILKASRTAAIMADAAHVILTLDARRHTGHFHIDEDVLRYCVDLANSTRGMRPCRTSTQYTCPASS